MNDRQFLIWLHDRLTEVHGESPWVDYMHKFRAIIATVAKDQKTNAMSSVTIDELKAAGPLSL